MYETSLGYIIDCIYYYIWVPDYTFEIDYGKKITWKDAQTLFKLEKFDRIRQFCKLL